MLYTRLAIAAMRTATAVRKLVAPLALELAMIMTGGGEGGGEREGMVMEGVLVTMTDSISVRPASLNCAIIVAILTAVALLMVSVKPLAEARSQFLMLKPTSMPAARS